MAAELFKGRAAIVTGGARGIGLACAAKITAGGHDRRTALEQFRRHACLPNA